MIAAGVRETPRIAAMRIPHDQLSAKALRGLIEEFVTRDGTDLSEAEAQIQRVLKALETGKAAIEYDEEEDSTTIVPIDPPPRKNWRHASP